MAVTTSNGWQTIPTEYSNYPYDLGANATSHTTYATQAVPTLVRGNNGTVWAYGKATSSLSAGTNNATINATTGVISSGTGYTVPSAFAAGEYGWIIKTSNEF